MSIEIEEITEAKLGGKIVAPHCHHTQSTF